MLSDVTMAAIESSLRGLSARQRVISDNVANLETPHYLAGTVDFESSLASAVAAGDPSAAAPSFGRSLAAPGPNGNNVSLDNETLAMSETNLKYQLAVESLNNKFTLLRTAIKG